VLHFAGPLTQGLKLRDGLGAADTCAFLVAQVFDLPFDQVQLIDAPHRFMRSRVLLALRVGQAL
jgi:hypothetical protein